MATAPAEAGSPPFATSDWRPPGRRCRLAWLAALLLAPCSAMGAHPLITDDTGTQGRLRYQVEVNGAVGRDTARAAGVERQEDLAETCFAFTIGLLDGLDAVVGVPWAWSSVRAGGALESSGNGVGDVRLELKWRFLERAGFSLAVKPGLTLPTGDEGRGFGNGRVSYALTLIATQELGPVTLHVNGGYSRSEYARAEDRAANRSDVWCASAAATVGVVKGLRLAANLGVESSGDRASATWPAFALAGIIWSVAPNLDLDAGVKAGLTGPETDLTGLFGMAWRF